MNTDYLTDLVKTYFPPVFFLWVIGNILLRLLVTKKKRKKRKKRKKGKRGGGFFSDIVNTVITFFCFLLYIVLDLLTWGNSKVILPDWCNERVHAAPPSPVAETFQDSLDPSNWKFVIPGDNWMTE